MWWVLGAVVVCVLFLLLTVLATMRETIILRGKVEALKQVVTKPPAPSFVLEGRPLPETLATALATNTNGFDPPAWDSELCLLVFVSQGCRPCENLISELAAAVARGDLRHDDLVFVTWAPDQEQAAFAKALPGPVIFDDGTLQRAGEVRGTPAVFLVSRLDWQVFDYSVEGDVEWVITQFSSRRPLATPA